MTENTDIDIFNLLDSYSMSHRLKREYSEILYADAVLGCDLDINDQQEIIFYIKRKDREKINIYTFIISRDYPFIPPQILINNNTYSSFLNLKTDRFNRIFQYINGTSNSSCLCCSSHRIRANWSPALTIKHIFLEIDKNRKIKYQIILKILADKIKDQYLIADIDLDVWLFTIACPEIILSGSTITSTNHSYK